MNYPTPTAYQYHAGGSPGGGGGGAGSLQGGSFVIPASGPFTFNYTIAGTNTSGAGSASELSHPTITTITASGGSQGTTGAGDPATNGVLGPANPNNVRFYPSTNNPGSAGSVIMPQASNPPARR